MKTNLTFLSLVVTVILLPTGLLFCYTDVTPADVHTRLVRGDTLLLLDVREQSEYRAGHIAEPEGQLPLTPALMPWSSGVLEANYQLLPWDMDIIVYCRSGGRSKSASLFLEGKGFTRIFNMTGGFTSWSFEKRNNGFGDHSGQWARATDKKPVIITCAGNATPATITIPPGALSGLDSVYSELHLSAGSALPKLNAPASDITGLYRLTILNRFGLSVFTADSLTLVKAASLTLYFTPNEYSSLPRKDRMTTFVPGKGWIFVTHTLKGIGYQRVENILRQWYNLEGFYGPEHNK
ncbi:MAG TPA: rhodanese-like domain-containing protein [bacterium]|nr:rhodanese-like domain-containing protein [bacterium]HPN45110.1 rhodanese-like domain-containing protein [bacterium]